MTVPVSSIQLKHFQCFYGVYDTSFTEGGGMTITHDPAHPDAPLELQSERYQYISYDEEGMVISVAEADNVAKLVRFAMKKDGYKITAEDKKQMRLYQGGPDRDVD